MTRLPGLWPSRCACGLRGFSTGHPCPVEKLAASLRPPFGLSSTRPPRHTGTPGARAASRAKAVARAAICRSAPCARTPPQGRPVRPRSRTRCAPTRVTQVWGWRINLAGRLFVGAHPVRDKPTKRYTAAWPSRTGCSHRQAKLQARHECAMRSHGQCAARLRFKSSAIRARCAAL